MKVGLYSITYLGAWYDGPALTMTEFVNRAAEMGFDGIEVDGKRPHGNPMDWSRQDREDFRALCADRGLDVIGVASNNDFSSQVPEHREAQLLMVREQIRLCADIGGRVVRLFFAWPGITLDAQGIADYGQARALWAENTRYTPRRVLWDNVKNTLFEAARMAQDAGVTLALQNHTPLLRTYHDMVDMVREVDSPALMTCLDVPILERQDDAYVTAAVQATGSLQVHSHFGGEYERAENGTVQQHLYDQTKSVTNYRTFVKELAKTGYDGYFAYEFCHPALDRQHRMVGMEFVDQNARLALEYMRDLLVSEGVYTGRGAALTR